VSYALKQMKAGRATSVKDGSNNMKPYFIENIPPILDKWGLKLGAAAMNFWQTGAAFQKGKDALNNDTFVHRVRMLDHDHLSKWPLTQKHPTGKNSNLISREPWLNDRKSDVIRNIQKAFNKPGHDPKLMTFPDGLVFQPPGKIQTSPGIGNKDVPFCDPSSNDAAWADAVDAFGLFDKASSSDGLGLGESVATGLGFNDPKDDYFLAVGNFDWFFLPIGRADLIPANAGTPDLLRVTFQEVGIYARDTYDFNINPGLLGDQLLGFWDVDAEILSLTPSIRINPFASLPQSVKKDPTYRPNMGLVRITNSCFLCYRDTLKDKGRDFLMYSDVKRFPLAGNRGFSFELQSGRPVG
jgi:hypothetical protein